MQIKPRSHNNFDYFSKESANSSPNYGNEPHFYSDRNIQSDQHTFSPSISPKSLSPRSVSPNYYNSVYPLKNFSESPKFGNDIFSSTPPKEFGMGSDEIKPYKGTLSDFWKNMDLEEFSNVANTISPPHFPQNNGN